MEEISSLIESLMNKTDVKYDGKVVNEMSLNILMVQTKFRPACGFICRLYKKLYKRLAVLLNIGYSKKRGLHIFYSLDNDILSDESLSWLKNKSKKRNCRLEGEIFGYVRPLTSTKDIIYQGIQWWVNDILVFGESVDISKDLDFIKDKYLKLKNFENILSDNARSCDKSSSFYLQCLLCKFDKHGKFHSEPLKFDV